MAIAFPIETSNQIQLVSCPAAFSVLAIVAVGLRLVSRRLAHRKLDSSDFLIIAASVVSTAFSGVVISGVIVAGGGVHVAEIISEYGPGPVQRFLKLAIAIQILWAVSLSLCKLSILVLYCRIFTVKLLIRTAICTAIVIVMWATATTLSALLICRPFAYTWDSTIAGGSCGDQVLSYLITGTLNIITDVIVLILPLPYLFRLELQLHAKLVLVATFAVGFFTCIVSALRLNAITSIDFADITYNVAEAQVFSTIEPALGITLACVPIMRPLFGGQHSKTGTAIFPRYTMKGEGSRRQASSNKRGAGLGRLDSHGSEQELRNFESASRIAAAMGSGGSSRHSLDTLTVPNTFTR